MNIAILFLRSHKPATVLFCRRDKSSAYGPPLLTYSMVQSPSWEGNWFAASQKMSRILWNPNVHYRTNKSPPNVPILGQPNPVHIPTSHLLEIHPNIHPSTPRSPQWSLSLRLWSYLISIKCEFFFHVLLTPPVCIFLGWEIKISYYVTLLHFWIYKMPTSYIFK